MRKNKHGFHPPKRGPNEKLCDHLFYTSLQLRFKWLQRIFNEKNKEGKFKRFKLFRVVGICCDLVMHLRVPRL